MTDTMVRMGELAASKTEGDRLVSLGLGSCIGLALLDRRVGVGGLAHIVLPASAGHPELNQLKFADHAVPELIARVVALGARRGMIEAVLVGGASMFGGTGPAHEVGQRNEAAVRAALAAVRIKVVAADTGGSRGRTVRLDPRAGLVTVRAAGGVDTQLHPALRAGSLNRSLQEVG
jgi:chemotaxis protein CheD